MLGCNLKHVDQAVLFATVIKSTLMLHMAQNFVEQLKTSIVLLSRASMGWNEPVYVYFPSHDIQHFVYLVLLYGDISFKTNAFNNT